MRTQQKLLYVVNEAYYFLSHYSALAQTALEAGYEVHVAAPDDHVWAPDGFGVQDVCDRGFGFHAIPLSRRGQNPLQDMRTAAALLGLYRRLRLDLVHHLTIKPVLYGGIASRVARIPAAVSAVTGLGQVFVARGLRAAGLRALVRLGYRIAMRHPNARVIVQNSADGETLLRLGAVTPNRLVLVKGSGVSLTRFTPSPEAGGIPLIALPGRLIWEKGVGEFVEAARPLREEGIGARFALIGDTKASNPRAVPE